jgi:hypothetical protein
MAQNIEVTEWSGLLEATRLALTTLRLDDLERLAALAEKMLEVSAIPGSAPSAALKLGHGERRKVLDEHRLLGRLLAATDRNLDVFRRLHGSLGQGLDSRWAR